MTTVTKHRALAGIVIGLLVLIGATTGSPAAYGDNSDLGAGQFSQLDAAEIDLLNSDDPVTVTINPRTGEFMSVERTVSTPIAPMGVTKVCSTGQACWKPWKTPYAAYGFDGSGASGTWSHRGSFHSGNYYAKPCWLSGYRTVCAQAYSPKNATIVWGEELTGKKVDLST